MLVKELVFAKIDDKIVPSRSMINSFFISSYVLERSELEIRQLTFFNLIKVLIRNETRIIFWTLIRALYKMGFLGTKENQRYSRNDFTLNIRKTFNNRKLEKIIAKVEDDVYQV